MHATGVMVIISFSPCMPRVSWWSLASAHACHGYHGDHTLYHSRNFTSLGCLNPKKLKIFRRTLSFLCALAYSCRVSIPRKVQAWDTESSCKQSVCMVALSPLRLLIPQVGPLTSCSRPRAFQYLAPDSVDQWSINSKHQQRGFPTD
jgi:hypothetical protein